MNPLRIKRWLRLLVWAHQYVAKLETKKGKQMNVQIGLRVKAQKCDRPVLKQTFSDTSADVLADDEEMLRDYF